MGLKEAVTALVNTTLGFLAYLAVRWWRPRGAQQSVSARGLVFAAILAAIIIPGVGLSMTLSGQLKQSVLEGYLDELKHFGTMSAALHGTANRYAGPARAEGDMAFLARRSDGTVTSSDPALFDRLAREFEIEKPSRTQLPGLDILKPKAGGPVVVTDDTSYWSAKVTAPDPAEANRTFDITVVHTTPEMIQKIDYELLLPSFALLFAIMSIGTLVSEALGLAVDRQFKSVIGPLQGNAPDEPMPDLASSRIRELETIVAAVNERSHRVNELGDSLRRAHLAEKSSKEEITKLIHGLPMAITTNSLDPHPKITFLNGQFIRTFGYTKEDIPSVVEWSLKAYPDEDYRREAFKKWDAALARALETKGLVESIEARVTCKDGTVRDTLISAVVLEGKVVVGFLDISERKRAEDELRESEARFRLMADAAPVLIWLAGPDSGCIWFNKVWLDFTGRTMEQELGEGWAAGVHPDDRKRCLDIYTDHFRRRAPFSMDYRLRRHDGEYRWIADSGVPRFDSQGNFAGFIGSCIDVTERKLAEDRLRRLVDALPISVMTGTLDFEGDITYVNEQFVRTFGYTLKEIAGSGDWLRLAYPDEKYRKQVTEKWLAARTHALETSGRIEPMEFSVVCKDGTKRDTLFSAIFLEERLIITLVDLTELKRAEQAMRSAQAKAEAESLVRERMTLAARASLSALWDWDLATGAVTWSDEMKSLFGIDLAKTGPDFDSWKSWRSILHPEDLQAAEERAHAAARSATPLALSYRIVMPDGSIRWVDTHGDIIRDEQGKAVRIAGISRDVTEQKKTEIALQNYRDQLEKLLAERTEELDVARRQLEKAAFEVTENIPVGTYTMVQPPGGGMARFSFVSTRFLEMAGLDRESVLADPLNAFACVHPDDYEGWLSKNAEAFEKKLPFHEECRVIVSGETRWFSAESTPREHPDGSWVWEGVTADITDRKLAEQRLAESEERLRLSEAAYRSLIENSPIGIFGTDSDGRITFSNPSMLRILGEGSADIEFAQTVYVNQEDRAEFMRLLRQDGKVEHFEVQLRRPDGRIIWADYNARIASGDPDGKFTIQGFFTDITERKTAEEKLRFSEEKYRSFFNLPMVGTAITAAQKGWIDANNQTCKILGYTHDELFSKTWSEISHPEDLAGDREQFHRMLRHEIDGYTMEKRFIRKDGSTVHTLMTIGVESGAGRDTGRYFVNILDITERKQLEEELRLSEERHRLLADNAADVINVIGLDGKLLYVSPSVERLIGYTQEEALKLSVEDILVPEAAAGARAGLDATAAAIESGGPLPEFHGEFPHRHKDGHTVWAEATSTCMVDKNGKYIANLIVTRDISERKRLEAALRVSEEHHRLLAENSADVIWLMDIRSMRFTYVSPSVQRLRGFTVEEVLRQTPQESMTPESYRIIEEELPRRLAVFEAGDESERTRTHEVVQPRKDGTFVHTEVTTTLLAGPDGHAAQILGISRDITERKAIEAQLAAAREREKKTEKEMRATLEKKLKTSLNAAAVAHEINQPLSRILLRARMDLEKSRDAGSDTLHALIADAERVVNTIEKMKVLLRNVQTVQQPVNLAQVITSTLHQLKRPLRQNRVTVKHTGPEEGCILMGDEVQLQMAFTNLIRNAIEAIAQSGTDKREISIEHTPRDGTVDIVIGDSGPGWPGGTIDDALLATSKPGGSGIGLYIVKTAVENHCGTIRIGRSPLGGAEFRLAFARLPANYPGEGRRYPGEEVL